MDYRARTVSAAVVRGLVRFMLLAALAVLSLVWAADEVSAGNKRFLWVVAALLITVAVWGFVQTWREVRSLRLQQRVRARH